MKYHTEHLREFESLDSGIGLLGDEYIVFKKALWYSLVGHSIRKNTLELGRIQTDCRFHVAFCLPSGYGKLHLENIAEQAGKGLGDYVSKPTSLHPEQLIGKVLRHERRRQRDSKVIVPGSSADISFEFESIPGHLADDIVIFDDAFDLVQGREREYKETQKYVIKALDPIGTNLITKRPVNIPREHSLTYYPTCSILLFFQPFPLYEQTALNGLFRRFIFLYLTFEQRDRETQFKEKVDAVLDTNSLSSFISWLKEIRKHFDKATFYFTDEARERFKDLHICLLDYGHSFSSKVANFTDIIAFSLQNFLLKMSVIMAASKHRTDVKKKDVELAYIDLIEFLKSYFTFIERKVVGTIDYDETWLGAKGEDRKMLEWLYEESALSLETSLISIKDYQKKIIELYSLSRSGARKRYNKHINHGWIKSKQIGQNNSRVWLAFEPRIYKDLDKKSYRDAYNLIVKKYFSYKKGTPWAPLDKSNNFKKLNDEDIGTPLGHPEDLREVVI